MFSHRITIITGHYGTGKTEVAVNLALSLAGSGEKVMIADLDNVNPYFRTREREKELEAAGIRLIATSQECLDADIPAVPAELLAMVQNRDYRGVIDVGGDPVGARVLARFQPKLLPEDVQLVYVSNAFRPEVNTAKKSIRYLQNIEKTCGLKCTGIVNNTHLCGETTLAEIEAGARLAEEISRTTGIPLLCHTAVKRLAGEARERIISAPVFDIDIYMKKPWER